MIGRRPFDRQPELACAGPPRVALACQNERMEEGSMLGRRAGRIGMVLVLGAAPTGVGGGMVRVRGAAAAGVAVAGRPGSRGGVSGWFGVRVSGPPGFKQCGAAPF